MSAEGPCPGCGLVLPAHDGPTHAYLGASPACWALYGEILAREHEDAAFRGVHGLTVDTYAVQHPGGSERRAARSAEEHVQAVARWAEDVWAAWSPHHATVRAWLDPGLDGPATRATRP